MMYRSGWATKAGQECILAVRLKRAFFNEILREAVPSTYDLQHSIEDITPFVLQQSTHAVAGFEQLQTPTERVYDPRIPAP
jgi:hypothetical protein